MDEDEAELLAELRAISSGTQRFSEMAAGVGVNTDRETAFDDAKPQPIPSVQSAPPLASSIEGDSPINKKIELSPERRLPPWKRNRGNRPMVSKIDGPDSTSLRADLPCTTLNGRQDVKALETDHRSCPSNVLDGGAAMEVVHPQAMVNLVDSTDETLSDKPHYGIKSEFQSTFRGERGGAAEDEELLAELRAISNRSSNRLFEENAMDTLGSENRHHVVDPSSLPTASAIIEAQSETAFDGLPSWKGKSSPALTSSQAASFERKISNDTDNRVTVRTQTPFQEEDSSEAVREPKLGIHSKEVSTFKGERGGAAEDEELLAELRAISNNSSSRGRFDLPVDGSANDVRATPPPLLDESTGQTVPASPTTPRSRSKRDAGKLPPWKLAGRRKASQIGGVEDVVSASFKEQAVKEESYLTLGKGASADGNLVLSTCDKVETGPGLGEGEDAATATLPGASTAQSALRGGTVPPWRRPKGKNALESQNAEVAIATAPLNRLPDVAEGAYGKLNAASSVATAPSTGFKSEFVSTFSGDRGGPAEDAELLALLRGVSNTADGSSRFRNDNDDSTTVGLLPPMSRMCNSTDASKLSVVELPSTASVEISTTASFSDHRDGAGMKNGGNEGVTCVNDLPSALKDKNWKVRCEAYDMLGKLVVQNAAGKVPGSVDTKDILDNLDDILPYMLTDRNAGALDKALEFGLLYAEHCTAASSSEQVHRLMTALLEKNALSSRPATAKLATMLSLRLMENGAEGVASIHAAIGVLLHSGISSKNVKIAQASVSLILDAAFEFGASCLPLSPLLSESHVFLGHANAKVREKGMAILVELCRALGTRDPLLGVLESLKKSQLAEFDAMLAKKPEFASPKRQLRSQAAVGANLEDALAAMHTKSEDMEAKRFAARVAINLMEILPKTDYSARLAMSKWSEKVSAMGIILEAAGERPYKLVPPSQANAYVSLIGEMKHYFNHTHFAVASKAMQVVAMLAEGIGEKLYPNLRPLLPTLLQLAKDKKLTQTVADCLDSFFGNVLNFDHLLEADDAVVAALDERKQKNVLVRTSALAYLARCIKRTKEAGPRGRLTPKLVGQIAKLCSEKFDDSDAAVRKSATECFQCLQVVDDEECAAVLSTAIESLKSSHSRVYKTLKENKSVNNEASTDSPKVIPPVLSGKSAVTKVAERPMSNISNSAIKQLSSASSVSVPPESMGDLQIDLSIDDAMSRAAAMHIPLWAGAEESDGVLAGLRSKKWLLKQNAILNFSVFLKSGEPDRTADGVSKNCQALIVLVREHTRFFKETNVNIMRAVLQFFMAICEYNESSNCVLDDSTAGMAVAVAIQKLSDKKLVELSKALLSDLCLVCSPRFILFTGFGMLRGLKSPFAHDEFARWAKIVLNDFGAATIGGDLPSLLLMFFEELEFPNPKVQKEIIGVLGRIHAELGPTFKTLAMSAAKKPSTRAKLETCFEDHPHNPDLRHDGWPKRSLALASANIDELDKAILRIEVPKIDLFSLLPSDCTERLSTKEGKNAWKIRKAALDETDSALRQCGGLIDTSASNMRLIIEHVRALRDRLSDTQINLKPPAARIIGVIIGLVDKETQVRLGKVVFESLIVAAMTDIKKPMRDAALCAISAGTNTSALEGGELNELALELLVSALVAQVNEQTIKSIGLPDVLTYLQGTAENLPKLDEVSSTGGQTVGEKLAIVIVECLSSSKSETRSAASSLVELLTSNGRLKVESLRKASGRLKPAKQRAIGPLIASLTQSNSVTQIKSVNAEASSRAEVDLKQSLAKKKESKLASLRPLNANTRKMDQTAGVEAAVKSSAGLRHPLAAHPGSDGRLMSLPWPEYPDEPSTTALFAAMKRIWAPQFSSETASRLFPPSGIHKQDDGLNGCELLMDAILHDKKHGTKAIEEHIDFVLRWVVFVLCCKEATVGLQAVLSLAKELLSHLIGARRELSDSEALLIAPYLVEKASLAKGRFKQPFDEVVQLLRCQSLISPRSLGANVCSIILERSGHPKARLSALCLSLECIEQSGLTGIGKRGVVATARLLDEEKIPENRLAVLNLLEAILFKMNGDIERLSKICGTSLSQKGREMLEDCIRSHHSRIVVGVRTEEVHVSNQVYPPYTEQKSSRSMKSLVPDVIDELPALSLRERKYNGVEKVTRTNVVDRKRMEETMAFTFVAQASPDVHDIVDTPEGVNGNGKRGHLFDQRENNMFDECDKNSTGGAAALLRARLLKVKEKGRPLEEDEITGPTFAEPFDARKIYEMGIEAIEVLDRSDSLDDADEDVSRCVQYLKIFHAAFSKQPSGALDLDADHLSKLRSIISSQLNGAIESLIRLIDVSFNRGDKNANAGISVPLLSVCLAALMALFRDVELSSTVSEGNLMLLIRVTGSILLDQKLSATSELDEQTKSQMVRAINKLAVQATVGAARNTSFQSLINLQQQVSLGPVDSSDDSFRFARVVFKLFGRVVKAEELNPDPFAPERLDVESLLCGMEDALAACETNEKRLGLLREDDCGSMITMLLTSMHNSARGLADLRRSMSALGIDSCTSRVGKIIESFDDNASLDHFVDAEQDAVGSIPVQMDAALVADSVGGIERDDVLESLRQFKVSNRSTELAEHLKDVSMPFRAFIEEKLGGDLGPDKVPLSSERSLSVSERLQSLRTRLQASELSVQTAANDSWHGGLVAADLVPTTNELSPSKESNELQSSSLHPLRASPPIGRVRGSRLAMPSPSKVSSATSFRDRIAASQHHRKIGGSSISATGRAAALRVRLEAVKKTE